jgi:hypothetical protein
MWGSKLEASLHRKASAMNARALWYVLTVAIGIAFQPPIIDAATVTLYAVKDNTLIESATGDRSNGAGEGIFCGRLGSNGNGRKLRLVVAFNLASIPANATITAVNLRLYLEQANGGTYTHNVYRLLGDWGEGTSNGFGGDGAPSTPNDATWIHRFFPSTYWTNPGGDFVAASSASASVGSNTGPVTWSSAGLISDVQEWVQNPSTNFGWMIRGNETSLSTAKKFISSNWQGNPDRPRLTVTYTVSTCAADINNDQSVNVQDLLWLINSWGNCPAPPSPCAADIAPPSGIVDVSDLLTIINSWGPCP